MYDQWGFHLILDVEACDIRKATSKEYIKHFTKLLVQHIDMVPYGEPLVEHFATHDPDKAGVSVVQLIETSNITMHFCDKTGDAYIDVFSCKPFQAKDVIALVTAAFTPKSIGLVCIDRQAGYKNIRSYETFFDVASFAKKYAKVYLFDQEEKEVQKPCDVE
jgi:S-adenosylmethionine/arginine decarboxylase-like enzyme